MAGKGLTVYPIKIYPLRDWSNITNVKPSATVISAVRGQSCFFHRPRGDQVRSLDCCNRCLLGPP